MDIIFRLICIAIGYAFGLFQTAYFYGKLKGVDIRKHGSGNAGTTNTLRVLGTKAGLIVFAGDVIKCIVAVGIVSVLISNLELGASYADNLYLFKMYTAAGVILGHNFPFYMGFRGGKGIAATAGFVISFHWSFVITGMLAFFVPLSFTHYVSLGSLLIYTVHMIQLVICGQSGFFGNMTQSGLNEMYVLYFLLLCMAFLRHRHNIVRLIKGTERKTYLSKKKKMEAE